MADLLGISRRQEKDKTTCSLLLFVTVMDYVFRERDRKTESELEGSKSLFGLSGNKTPIVCGMEN